MSLRGLEKLKQPEGRVSAEFNGGYTDTDWLKIWRKKNAGYSWRQLWEVVDPCYHNTPNALCMAANSWLRGYEARTAPKPRKKRKAQGGSEASDLPTAAKSK